MGMLLVTLGVFGIVYAATAATDSVLARTQRFSMYTNSLYFFPFVEAAYTGADAEALLLVLVIITSTLHHSCVIDASVRHALAFETYTLLAALSLAAAAALLAMHAVRRERVPREQWQRAVVALLFLAVGFFTLFLVAAFTLDGCAYPTTEDTAIVARLAQLWNVSDLVTAASLFVMTLGYALRVRTSILGGVVTTGATALLVLEQYRVASLISVTTELLGLGVLVLVTLVLYVLLYRPDKRPRIDVCEGVASAALALAGVLFFALHNVDTTHGVWHALTAAALLLVYNARL